ncbi:MAG: hypothetical protein WCD16_16210 [Paracoccaceae bacterium]
MSRSTPVLVWGFTSADEFNRVWLRWQSVISSGLDVRFLLPRHAFPGAEGVARRINALGAQGHVFSGRNVSSAELERFIVRLDSEHICLCPADCMLHPDFLPAAARAFPGAVIAWLLSVNETWDRSVTPDARLDVLRRLRQSEKVARLPPLRLEDPVFKDCLCANVQDELRWLNRTFLSDRPPLPEPALEETQPELPPDGELRLRLRDAIMNHLTPEAMAAISEAVILPA